MDDDEKQPLNEGEAPPAYSDSPPPSQYPPAQAPPIQQATTTTTVITQPAVIQNVQLGEFPVTVTCPSGGHQITTNVEYQNGTITYVVALILCLFLGPCCAIIPFFVDSLKDVVHTCPIDGTVIGVYKRG